jgi:hypothetical protein
MGLWSTQANVEGILLTTAWYWGSDSSVINNPLGKPGHTPLYVGHSSASGSVDSDCMFPLHFIGGLLNWGIREMNE